MSILNKMFTKLAEATAPKEKAVKTTKTKITSVAPIIIDTITTAEAIQKTKEQVPNRVNSDTLGWKDVPDEEKKRNLEMIQSELMVKGYKAIPEILSQYRVEMVQHFVMIQYVQLGMYNPESDNLEQHDLKELIQIAVQNNQLMFEQRMFESGKAFITKGQIEMLTKNGVSSVNMPKDRFTASRMIEKILQDKGIDTSVPRSTNPTEKQIDTIDSLCAKLGVSVPFFTTCSEASTIISDLSEQCKKLGLEEKASDKQIELAKDLTKKLNKRWTNKRELAITTMSKADVSKEIESMYKELDEKHPEATQGQIDYMIQLMQMLRIPYSADEVTKMTKKEATAKLDELRKRYLYVLTRSTNPSMTQESINAMNPKAVKELILTIRNENKTRDLTKDAEFSNKMNLDAKDGTAPF